MLDAHAALIYTMVLCSAADREMSDSELIAIGDIVRHLPMFRDYDDEQLPKTAAACADRLSAEDGLDALLDDIKEALPARLRETAYALACDVVAADGQASQEELRMLELIRHHLEISRLSAAAIEHGARARHLAV
ncbi:MAG: tellurite resistance TerB family protein [Alphaproteobacteria bacterium]